jgi:hypothetical protein
MEVLSAWLDSVGMLLNCGAMGDPVFIPVVQTGRVAFGTSPTPSGGESYGAVKLAPVSGLTFAGTAECEGESGERGSGLRGSAC